MAWKPTELFDIDLLSLKCNKYFMFQPIANINSRIWFNGININSFKKLGENLKNGK
ncbi:MAG: hypothetical protein ACE5ES_03985 [Candidatus Nanoarchaeia archaeon]